MRRYAIVTCTRKGRKGICNWCGEIVEVARTEGIFAIIFAVPLLTVLCGPVVLLVFPSFLYPRPGRWENSSWGGIALAVYWVVWFVAGGSTVVLLQGLPEILRGERHGGPRKQAGSRRWQCPHCHAVFDKTSALLDLQRLGGRKVSLGGPECPTCGARIDLQSLLDGAFDI